MNNKKLLWYSPPKSQLWGHRVNRHSPLKLRELTDRFLADMTRDIAHPTSSDLQINNPEDGSSDSVANIGKHVSLQLGLDPDESMGQHLNGISCLTLSWNLEPDEVKRFVPWIDENWAQLKRENLDVMLFYRIQFNWKDTPADSLTCRGQPREQLTLIYGTMQYLSTGFNFDTSDQYFAVKEYLTEIGLARLNDKHVKPKGSLG